MKKILFTLLAVSSLLVVSCRDNSEDLFSPEDQANLEVLNNTSADGGNGTSINEGDPIPPPRK